MARNRPARQEGGAVVIGQHHTNPLSIAKAEGKPIVKVMDLGDGYVLGGIAITPVFDEEKKNLCFVLVAQLGRNSPIVGVRGAPPHIIAELGRVSLEELKASIATALDETPAAEAPPA